MMKKPVIVCVALLVVGVLWYAFRPELLFIDRKVDEGLPSADAAAREGAAGPDRVVASGTFFGVAHETKGQAAIHRLGDGRLVLRLTDFTTSNGPDVRVLLSASPEPKDNDSVKSQGWVEVAKLKGNVGDQNYELPADVDVTKFHSVTIWCSRFGVNFGSAPLSPGSV